MELSIRDGAIYDAMYEQYTADIGFYKDEATRIKGPVLELAAGTGRVAVPLHNAGVDITGLDSSQEMLDRAVEKNPRVKWVFGDATRLGGMGGFAAILMPFNSFLLFKDMTTIERLLMNVRGHLHPNGVFIFDIHNPNLDFLAPSIADKHIERKTLRIAGQDPVELAVTSAYDGATQVNHLTYTFSQSNKEKVEHLDQRLFFPQEIDYVLRTNGFKIINKYGWFDRTPFNSASRKQILKVMPD